MSRVAGRTLNLSHTLVSIRTVDVDLLPSVVVPLEPLGDADRYGLAGYLKDSLGVAQLGH